jgi:integrase
MSNNRNFRRAQGEGSLFQIKRVIKGEEREIWKGEIKKTIDGKLRTFSVSHEDKRICAKLFEELKNQLTTDTYIPKNNWHFGDWMEKWVTTYKLPSDEFKPSTHANYKQYIKNHIVNNPIGAVKLQELDGLMLQEYFNRKKANWQPSTVKKLYVIIHGGLEQARKLEYVPKNVSDDCTVTGKNKVVHMIISGEQQDNLLNIAQDCNPRLYVAIKLGLRYGLRRGEVLGLKWEHIDYDNAKMNVANNVVTVPGFSTDDYDPKGHQAKKLPLMPEDVEMLKEYHKDNMNTQYVISSPTGMRYHPRNFIDEWYDIRKKAKLEKLRFHDLRHNCGSNLNRAGANAFMIQQILRHQDIRTSQGYIGEDVDKMREIIAESARVADTKKKALK